MLREGLGKTVKLRPAKTIWLGLMCLAVLTCMLPLEPVDKYLVFIYLLSALFLGWLLYVCGRLGHTVCRQQAALSQATEELHRLSEQSVKTQQQLERQVELYRNLLKAVPMGLYWKDCDGRLQGYNPEYAHICGLKRMEEGLSLAQTELLEPRQGGLPLDMEVMNKDIELLFLPQSFSRNGMSRDYLVSKIAVKDDRGRVCGLLGSILNPELLKTSQKRSICSYLKHQCAAEAMPAMVTDPKGRVVYVNAALRRRWGRQDGDVAHQELSVLLPTEACRVIQDTVHRFSQEGRQEAETFYIQHGADSFAVTARPIFEGTTLKSVLMVLSDVSGLKQTEEFLERHLYCVGRMCMTLTGRLETLRHLLQRPAALQQVSHTVDLCLETIAHYNALMLENENVMETQRTVVNIRQLLESIQSGITTHCDNPPQICIEIAEHSPSALEADGQKLHQAMMILAEQAIEAGASSLTLSVDTTAMEGQTFGVWCVLEQAGAGLPQCEHLDAVLNPEVSLLTWYRDCLHRDQSVSLRIAARLLSKAGYRLEAECGSQRTRYRVLIGRIEADAPLSQTDLNPERAKTKPTEMAAANEQLPCILIVDDVAENRMLLETMLARLGCRTVCCVNGAKAVDACGREAFDLILMDIRMPEMDGLEATRQIRAGNLNARTPIFAMTASDDKNDQLAALEAGCTDCVHKPINRKSFEQKINRILAGARQLRQAEQGQRIVSFLDGDPDYHKAIELFVNGLPGRVEELRAALERNDLQELGFKAHALKGLGGFAGFPVYSEKAARIEEAIAANDLAGIQQTIDQIVQLCQRTKVKSDVEK